MALVGHMYHVPAGAAWEQVFLEECGYGQELLRSHLKLTLPASQPENRSFLTSVRYVYEL